MHLEDLMAMQKRLQDHIRTNSNRPTLEEIVLMPEAIGDTIKEDALALTDELHEALNHVGWKSWAVERGIIDREAYLREVVDAMFFLLNLLNIAPGVTADEIEKYYTEKWARNMARYSTGTYSMVEGKCKHCGDDFGDIVARGGTVFTDTRECFRCAVKNP